MQENCRESSRPWGPKRWDEMWERGGSKTETMCVMQEEGLRKSTLRYMQNLLRMCMRDCHCRSVPWNGTSARKINK